MRTITAFITAAVGVARSAGVVPCAHNGTLWCEWATGQVLHSGGSAVGLLLNSRMIQGIFDDANATTAPLWAYPDGQLFDPRRQSAEFVGNMTAYAACGLDAFTVGMHGGGPQVATPPDQPWEVLGFDAAGNPNPAFLDRLSTVIEGAAAAGITPIVQLFYQGQIERITGGDAAVAVAVDAMMQWLVSPACPWWSGPPRGPLLLDLANEVGLFNRSYTSLQPSNIHTLLQRAKAITGDKVLVSTSFPGGGTVPPDAVVAASDFILIHCNGMSPAAVATQIAAVRALPSYQALPKPILYNECGTNLTVMDAALANGAGWGYYDQGASNYRDGFQSPPTNWLITSSADKRAFFGHVAAVAGGSAPAACAAAMGME